MFWRKARVAAHETVCDVCRPVGKLVDLTCHCCVCCLCVPGFTPTDLAACWSRCVCVVCVTVRESLSVGSQSVVL